VLLQQSRLRQVLRQQLRLWLRSRSRLRQQVLQQLSRLWLRSRSRQRQQVL
jgi:hypothetical protein